MENFITPTKSAIERNEMRLERQRIYEVNINDSYGEGSDDANEH